MADRIIRAEFNLVSILLFKIFPNVVAVPSVEARGEAHENGGASEIKERHFLLYYTKQGIKKKVFDFRSTAEG